MFFPLIYCEVQYHVFLVKGILRFDQAVGDWEVLQERVASE